MKTLARGSRWLLVPMALTVTACEPPRTPATQPATQAVSQTPTPPERTPPPASAPTTALEQIQQKAEEAYQSARDWAADLRDRYWNNARDEFNKLIERAREAASGVKPEVARRIKELRERAADAANALEKAREIGGQAFEDAKQRFEQTLDDLRGAIGNAPASQPATEPAEP